MKDMMGGTYLRALRRSFGSSPGSSVTASLPRPTLTERSSRADLG